jgi:hypothetical protein
MDLQEMFVCHLMGYGFRPPFTVVCYRRWTEDGVIIEKQNADRRGKGIICTDVKMGLFLWGRREPWFYYNFYNQASLFTLL